MLGKLFAAQAGLERVIAALVHSHADTTVADAQIAHLSALQASIGTADAAMLTAINGEVAAAIAQSRSIEQQAREQIAAAAAAELNQAATASRSALRDAMDSLRHIPLTFTSAEDERAYRDREDERRRYMAAQQAKHTPEGDLNASGAGLGQMVDAKAHGAKGPEFDKRWKELVETTEKLRAAAKANGVSTAEFDKRLGDDIRRILKSKGLTDAEIDAQFAAHNGDPLEAAKAFVRNDGDLAQLKRSAERSDAATDRAESDPAKEDMKGAIASLQTAGVIAKPLDPAAQPTHGVDLAAVAKLVRQV